MKITILALTALAIVAAAPFAAAQEETSSPSPAASPETSASEQKETTTSDPSVSVTTERTASPTPKPASSPSPSKTSSPAAKKTESSETATTNSTSTAVMPTKKSTPEATIRDIEDKWEASVMSHDQSVAKAYLADDFRGVSSKGKVMSKSNLLSEIKKDTDVYTSTKNGKVDVRVFGGQFAVATGVSTEVGKAKDGQAFKRSFRWTDVWVLRSGKWQCVASQAMLTK
jgi:ketosteroid isomerase-like protein